MMTMIIMYSCISTWLFVCQTWDLWTLILTFISTPSSHNRWHTWGLTRDFKWCCFVCYVERENSIFILMWDEAFSKIGHVTSFVGQIKKESVTSATERREYFFGGWRCLDWFFPCCTFLGPWFQYRLGELNCSMIYGRSKLLE